MKITWVPNISSPGWGHLEPFHDAECELIPAYIGEEIAKAFAARGAEIERLRDLVESAYREGWEDGFENDAHSQDRNWKSSHAFRALKEEI